MNHKDFSNEDLYKEIDLIQACIDRMAKNSFMCKGWMVSLLSIILVFSSKSSIHNTTALLITLLAVDLVFWWMDTFYLYMENLYRKKYEWIIKKRIEGNREYLFDLNPYNQNMWLSTSKKVNKKKIMFSITITPIYLGLAVIILILFWNLF